MQENEAYDSPAGSGIDTHKLIGGKVLHICVLNDELVGQGVAISIENGGREYTFHVYLPRDIKDVQNYLELEEW